MTKPDDQSEEALQRLDERLDALEAGRAKPASVFAAKAAGDGYRLLAELIGGVLGGLGLGWVFDRFAGTSPLGMVSGLLIGLGVSVFMIVRQASRMSAKASAEAGPVRSVPEDDEED
jgi:ATP synthase protein I